ncbi:hypothetical protein NE857_14925 [Nocardiopsis exhalans]|uniref:Uncharacterized protein n=2 Tax=Nocardiopsis TaxID=2013 RepID=A0A840VZG2_9ACTN|nr:MULTISPECIES: hypothetical protein [Nocardiopsis]MBB5489890.1 hypothetical protein [Nocardiopsis metallicus]USY22787.1 hypothetical protein NE857_14925 [Nocardiopsis exhalans]
MSIVDSISDGDMTEFHKEVLDAGWCAEANGAWVLQRFREDYSGIVSKFSDVTGYEAAVNGRSIPDFDIEEGEFLAESLFRRAYSFARRALLDLGEIPGSPPAVAYVSISPALYDESIITGHVTFCAAREEERPYIEEVSGFTLSGILLLSSSDFHTD